jgi:hypothetical protein
LRRLLLAVTFAGLTVVPAALAATDVQSGAGARGNAGSAPAPSQVASLRPAGSLEHVQTRPVPVRPAKVAAVHATHRLDALEEGGSADTPAQLQSIAACESGGDPNAIGGGGAYRGKYQFDQGTWASVGGSGDPASAPEAEQDKRAAMLYARSGAGHWPVCGS